MNVLDPTRIRSGGDRTGGPLDRPLERAGVVIVDAIPGVKNTVSTADLADAVLSRSSNARPRR
jgi:hypothetical protein